MIDVIRPARALLLTAALLAALVARLASPTGFMPARIGGHAVIVACPDQGPALTHHGMNHGGGPAKHRASTCDFASAAGGAAAVGDQSTAVNIIASADAGPMRWQVRDFILRAARFERPLSQAPPLA